jgi:hypothetical protein
MAEDMSELEGTVSILERSLKSADEDRDKLDEEWESAKDNGKKLRDIIYKPFDATNPKDKIPGEFRQSTNFIKTWDDTDEALGNTILMVFPPTIFEQPIETPVKERTQTTIPNIIINPQQQLPQPKREASKGFWAGIWDYNIAKRELEKKQNRRRPVITTERIVYDPKEVVYQLIPQLNEIKQMYFAFLRRHQSYGAKPSRRLCQRGHEILQEEMSKYFNVVFPFCYASVQFQKEKVRRDKLIQVGHFARIATAQAEASAFQQMYIPPNMKAMLRALEEGRPFHPDGITMDSSSKAAEKVKRYSRGEE